MEIESIEKKTFEEMLYELDELRSDICSLCQGRRKRKLNEWLDAQDVCMILNISPRTLQSYRESGKIGFSQINHKIFYKAEEIERFLNNQSK